MAKLKIQIDDQVRDMTADEMAKYQAILDDQAAMQAELETRATAKAALLERLGISADEAALLLS